MGSQRPCCGLNWVPQTYVDVLTPGTCESVIHSVMSDSLRPHGLSPVNPLSMGFARQEYWSGLPFLFPGDLPDPGLEPVSLMSPSLACWCFTTSATILFSHKKKEILLFVTTWMDLEGIMPVNARPKKINIA